jgi:tetratricopeptide (TPR) repeat protein
MNIKKIIVIAAAVTFSLNVSAQSTAEGIKMYNYERYESAKRILTPLAATDPIANYYLGLAELNLGNIEGAKAIFSKYPDNNANISGMARVSFMSGNEAGGMQLVTNLAGKTKRKEWEPLKYAADALTYAVNNKKANNIQQAIDWYNQALAVTSNAELLIASGDAYLLLPTGGGPAATAFEKAVEKDPKNSLAFSRIGKIFYEAKNYKYALENYEKAKEADPSNPLPYCDLADAYSYVGNYDLSLKNLEKCLEYSDKTSNDIIKYAGTLFLNKDYKNASQKAQDLIQQGVAKPGLYGIVGASQYELKDSVNKYGLENYKKYITTQDAAKITPADYRSFAKILLRNGQAAEANTYLEKAISLDAAGSKSDAYRQTAEALREAREWKLAGDWYKKLTVEFPTEAKAIDYFYYGVCYYYAHDFDGARPAFEQMETKFPDQPSATYWRGRTEAAIDSNAKTGGAVQHYIKWLGTSTEKKAGDLKQAYQYLIIYYYNTEDRESMKKYLEELRKIDPADGLLKQMDDILKKPAKPAGDKKAK